MSAPGESSRVPLPRAREVHAKYDEVGRAADYATGRWTRSARARRTDRKERRLVAQLLARAGAVESILDVPCGAGRFHGELASAARRVVSFDAARSMLDEARAVTADQPVGQGSADALPFADRAFDLVFCFRLLHHFRSGEERRVLMRELGRVSRRFVLLSSFDSANFQAWRHRVRKRRTARFAQSFAEFEADAAEAGLVVVARRFVLRGVSEQTILLLEKRPARGAPRGHTIETLVEAPTVTVRRVELESGDQVALKRSHFPYLRQRLAGAFRHSWFGTPKPIAESRNLERLREAGIPAIEPLATWVRRDRLGFVRDSWLMTRFVADGERLDRWLMHRQASAAERERIWRALGESVRELHGSGCLYGALRARNVLVRTTADPPVTWLDAAKARWIGRPLVPGERAADLAPWLVPLVERGALLATDWDAFRIGAGLPEAWRTYADLEDAASADATTQRQIEAERARLACDV